MSVSDDFNLVPTDFGKDVIVVGAENGDGLVLFDEESPADVWIQSDYWFDLGDRQ